jgi:hypothetical protein
VAEQPLASQKEFSSMAFVMQKRDVLYRIQDLTNFHENPLLVLDIIIINDKDQRKQSDGEGCETISLSSFIKLGAQAKSWSIGCYASRSSFLLASGQI